MLKDAINLIRYFEYPKLNTQFYFTRTNENSFHNAMGKKESLGFEATDIRF